MFRINVLAGVSAAAVLAAGTAGASSLVLSTAEASVIDEQPFVSGDLFSVDENPGSAGLFVTHEIFAELENVDAAALQPDGTVILSTDSQAQIGPASFEDGDLVSYDPASGEATTWLDDDSEFFTDVDIDAVHVLEDGRVLFSVRDDVTLFPTLPGEALYLDGDVIEYDPELGTASLFLGEEIFTWNVDEDGDSLPDFANPDVDGLSMLPNGNLLLSIRSAARIGEAVYSDGEVIEYDPETGIASLHLSLFERSASNLDLDAVAILVPEPSRALLLAVALAALAGLPRRAAREAAPVR